MMAFQNNKHVETTIFSAVNDNDSMGLCKKDVTPVR